MLRGAQRVVSGREIAQGFPVLSIFLICNRLRDFFCFLRPAYRPFTVSFRNKILVLWLVSLVPTHHCSICVQPPNCPQMILTIILAAFAVACGHLALLYWRALMRKVASKPLSDRIHAVRKANDEPIGSRDFRPILGLYDMTPGLGGARKALTTIRSYYWVIERVGPVVPGMNTWAESEMATCSRYVAVIVDQHLERNMAFAAKMRAM
jgi:hypothetical protein